ncbi:MAG: hypothetical protein IJA58_01915, partial [Lachnospiraceae bacterium]|nr:hypothetical protein [Lachnospiraceae bacterium]
MVEKRDPAEWPDSLTNDVLKKIEKYYEDRSPFRNNLIAFENDFSQGYETYYRKTITPILIELFMPQPKEEKPAETIEETTKEESSVEESTEEEATQELETPGELKCEHNFDDGTVVTEADCVLNGEIVYTCQACGEQKSEVINASHRFMLKKESLADEEHYGYKLYECERCKERELRDFQEKTVGTDYLVPQIDNYALYGRCDWLFFTGNSSLQDYQGSNLMSEAQLIEWKTAFEALQAACDQKGIKLVVLVLPNKEQVYREYMPTFQISSQTSRAQQIAAYMQANSIVNYVYPLEDMLETKIYYDVYLKQDTHWNDVGSFVGAMALCRALG